MAIGKKLVFGGLALVVLGLFVPIGVARFNPYRNDEIVCRYREKMGLLKAVYAKDYHRKMEIEADLCIMENTPCVASFNDWNSMWPENICYGLIFGGLGASLAGMACGASEIFKKKD